jgi:type II secretory pathway component PulF
MRAFAEDQSGAQRWRVHRLARLLEGGSSLPSALEQVAGVLPPENVLAIRFGTQSGTLMFTLRALIEESESLANIRRGQWLRSTLIYPALMLLVIVGILTFFMITIAPAFEKIMGDYDVESLVFQWGVFVSNLVVDYWWLAAGAALLVAWIWWTDWPGRSWRLSLFRPRHDTRSADVLQNLSVVTQAGHPIAGALSTLARYHHDPTFRQELLFVRNEVEQGADLWNTLRKVKLLTRAEVALLEASQKVGNLAWAMTQLATCKRRRMRSRMELLGQLVEPAAVLLMGGIVFVICLMAFSPLVNLILNLA